MLKMLAAAAALTMATAGHAAPPLKALKTDDAVAPPPPMPKGCFASPPGTTYKWGAGNLFPTKPDHGGNYGPTMDSAAKCCSLCQSFKNCTYFTYSAGGTPSKPICYGYQGGCCFLNTAAAAAGKKGGCATCTAGSTKPLTPTPTPTPPTPPAPPKPTPPGPTVAYMCVLSACVKCNGGNCSPQNNTAHKTSTCDGACAAPALSSLAPQRMQMLAVGAVQPAGWLQRQLTTQVNGLSGHLQRFWPDVMNSSWIYPANKWKETYSDRGGNLPYWLNGVIPMVMQTRSLSDRVDSTGYNLTHTVVDYMRRLVASQNALKAQGHPAIWQNFNLGTWNVMRSCILLMSAVPAETPLLLPFVLSYITAAHQRLKDVGWPNGGLLCTDESAGEIRGGGYCRFRYVDWMHILQQLLDAHGETMAAADKATVYEHMAVVGEWGFDFRAFYAEPCHINVSTRSCLPMGGCNSYHVQQRTNCTVPGWFKTFPNDRAAVHGVHGGAMPLKEGTVRWRMTRRQEDVDLNERKVEELERWQGQPTGQFSADEQMAGRQARRGTELCTIVETMYSLGAMGQNATVKYIDRLERIALNALPAALTADMWSHNYLSMLNEVQAISSSKHPWGEYGNTGTNCTTYGLADKFTGVTPCCTANHNQGWPKLTQFGVQVDLRPASKAIYVVLLLPTNATLPPSIGGGAKVSVETEYPFGDAVTVRVIAMEAVTLHVRVPTWAKHATASLNGAAHAKVDGGAYHTVQCKAGETVLALELNPDIVVERHWGPSEDIQEGNPFLPILKVNGVAVMRGPLLFALSLDETLHKMGSPSDQFFNESVHKCFESGCSQDVEVSSTEHWAYALLLPNDGGAPNSTVINPKGWSFKKTGSPGKHPFAGRASPTVAITVEARELPSWTMDPRYTASPLPVPVSPVDCAKCGPVKTVQLVPFGSTRLRMGMLPYTLV